MMAEVLAISVARVTGFGAILTPVAIAEFSSIPTFNTKARYMRGVMKFWSVSM